MTDYADDETLVASPALVEVKFDDIDNEDVSIGVHKALIKKVKSQKQNWDKYTGYQALVMFNILEGKDKGKTIYDRIPVTPHEEEPDWMMKKRLMIAKRTGLISRESKGTEPINWKHLEGMMVTIDVTPNEYEKNGVKITKPQVSQYKSYYPVTESAGAPPAGAAKSNDAYSDI